VRILASASLLFVQFLGILVGLSTLWTVWIQRLLVTLIVDRLLPGAFASFAPALTWGFVGVCMLVAAALVVGSAREAIQILKRMARNEPEIRAGLRVQRFAVRATGCLLFDVLVLSTPEAVSGPFRVRFPVMAYILATFLFALYRRWARRVVREEPKAPGRIRRVADVVAMNVVVALVVAEVSLRIVAATVAIPLLVTDESSSRIRRDAERKLPGELRFGFPMNAGGHYDSAFLARDQRDRTMVASIGDSFSYGVVPHAYHFTTVVERERPDIEVYNMGYPGTGPIDYAYVLEGTALPLDPDLVVIQLFMGNDVGAGFPFVDPPRWCDADFYMLGILWYRLRLLSQMETAEWSRTAEPESEDAGALEAAYPWLADPALEPPHMSHGVFMRLETVNATVLGTDSDAVYGQFFARLDELIRAAYDTPIAFVMIPDEFQVEDGLWNEILAARDQAPSLDRDLAQRKTAAWFRERGVPVLDLLPILRAVEPLADGKRHLYHLYDTHFNRRGNEVAGLALAEFIDRQLARPRHEAVLPATLAFGDGAPGSWRIEGWNAPEDALSWSEGEESSLLMPVGGDARDIQMTLDCLPFPDPDGRQQRVRIVVNETGVGEISLRPGRNSYRVTITAQALRHRRNLVRFRYAYTTRPTDVDPASHDERELAVAWYSVRLEEAPAGGSPDGP